MIENNLAPSTLRSKPSFDGQDDARARITVACNINPPLAGSPSSKQHNSCNISTFSSEDHSLPLPFGEEDNCEEMDTSSFDHHEEKAKRLFDNKTQLEEVLQWLLDLGNEGEASNEWLLKEYVCDPRNSAETESVPVNLQAEIALLALLDKADVPIYLFDQIIKFMKYWVVPDKSKSKFCHFRSRDP